MGTAEEGEDALNSGRPAVIHQVPESTGEGQERSTYRLGPRKGREGRSPKDTGRKRGYD